MTVARLKEANLQHHNEIRHAAFVPDTEQGKNNVVCILHLWTLNFSAGIVLPGSGDSDSW